MISLAVSLTGVTLASSAGYSIARARYRDTRGIVQDLLLLVPGALLLFPLWLAMAKLHLTDASYVVALIYFGTVFPLCLWQLKVCYEAVPHSLEEAARIEGASHWRAFYRIILPIASPTLAMALFVSFVAAWNEVLFISMLVPDRQSLTWSSVSSTFAAKVDLPSGSYVTNCLLIFMPPALLFVALGYFLRGHKQPPLPD